MNRAIINDVDKLSHETQELNEMFLIWMRYKAELRLNSNESRASSL